ncbi:hypothetical protein UO65_3496 [Actinokineospora spheciospongiae]|uniref:GtrA/DPMS transmembrane domain-containing protein n=1 Tax=Actinokineospora spheciospongiae TaxID=909613 RepID=W7IK52_9PSEU|nr:GtrA family protein [Actinokineospora spheciospongiae]EWC61230.1 hypothetical protein UO65_3496 [Actinokineospora spheciospongiae]
MHVHLGKPAFSRYSVASLLATGISQLVLFGLYAWGGVGALPASVIAFAVGAVPHFVLVRWWAWGQRGVPRLTGQVVGYLVTTAVGGLVSVVLTAGVDWLVEPLLADRGVRTLVLNVTYVLSGLPVFLAKYAVLDRVFAGPGAAEDPEAAALPSEPLAGRA